VNFNGPLIKDRLFLSNRFHILLRSSPVRDCHFRLTKRKANHRATSRNSTLVLSNRHSADFHFRLFPLNAISLVNLDFFRPQSVTPNYKQKDFVVTVRDRYQVREGLLQSAFSFQAI